MSELAWVLACLLLFFLYSVNVHLHRIARTLEWFRDRQSEIDTREELES